MKKLEFSVIDPESVAEIQHRTLWIDEENVLESEKAGHHGRFYQLRHVPEIADDPNKLKCIVKGWNRCGYHECQVYVGLPETNTPAEGIALPPKKGELFFFYVTSRHKVYDWRWEKFDLDDEDQFKFKFGDGEIIWPKPKKTS